MFGKSANLACGSLLLLFGAYASLNSFKARKPFWEHQETALVHPTPTASPNATALGSELVDVATVKAYGPLASATQTANTNDGLLPPSAVNQSSASPASVVSGPASPLDHVAANVNSGPLRLVQQRFAVKSYRAFDFIVPAHSVHARLHGQFEATGPANGTPIVDVLLMKEQDYQEFAHNHPSETVFSQPGSSGGSIGWTLHSTLDDPQKYYLVFVNSDRGSETSVNADFTISFE